MKHIILGGMLTILLTIDFTSATLVAQKELLRVSESFFPSSALAQFHQQKEFLVTSPVVVEKIFSNGLPLFSNEHIQRPSRSKNVGRDINNVGNLMDGRGEGAIGVYKSVNGRYYSVFATVEDGYQALIKEIEKRKQTTKASRLLLSDFLGGWVLGRGGMIDKDSYYYKYAIQRIGSDKSIKEIPTEVLAEVIMMGEATLDAYKKGGVDLTHLLSFQTQRF